MKTLSILAVALTLGLTFSSGEAEAAKRLGSGKSSGMQRQMTAPEKAPAAAPGQAPSASSTTAKSPATATAPQTQPKRSWMGPLAGLAAGLGLAALASHFGFGEELASLLMIGLLVMAVMVAIGFIMRKRATAQQQPAMAGAGGFQYAASSLDQQTTRGYEPSLSGSSTAASVTSGPNIPADFDTAGFVRNAKIQFIRLQAANDAGNLDDIREFTTPEMFAEVKMSIEERGSAPQETDVIKIDAEVIEVAEEDKRYVVSVRFSGLIREDKNGPEEPIDEVWHLVKPREGKAGWLLAGIQQMQ